MNVLRVQPAWRLALAVGSLLVGAPVAMAQSSLVDELRLGILGHSIEPSNSEEGLDLNFEVLFPRSKFTYKDGLLDFWLNPRFHVGGSINSSGNTNQLYAGLTWDWKLTPKLMLEISGGGAVHDGPTGRDDYDSFGCSWAFRASASLGYAIDDRWTLYGTFAHISNAGLCDHINTGLNSAGLRLGYKLN